MKPLYSRATSVYKQAPVAILVSNQGCCFYIYRYLVGNFHYSVALQLEVCFWVEKDLLRVKYSRGILVFPQTAFTFLLQVKITTFDRGEGNRF